MLVCYSAVAVTAAYSRSTVLQQKLYVCVLFESMQQAAVPYAAAAAAVCSAGAGTVISVNVTRQQTRTRH
jgi:hypothetical protein